MVTKVKLKPDNMLTLPVVAMRGVVLFPNTVNHFDVGRKRSIAAVEHAMRTRTPVLLITQKDTALESPEKADLFKHGIVAEVQQVLRVSEEYIKVLVECKYRARLIELHSDKPFYEADIVRANARGVREGEKDEAEALVRTIREQFDAYLEYNPKLATDIIARIFSESDPARFAELVAFNLNLDFKVKQDVLDAASPVKRLTLLHDALVRENNVLGIERDINNKVQDALDQNQKEYYLREQIRVIANELGEGADALTEADEYRKRIKALPLEAAHIKKLLKEVDRLTQTPGNSQEAAVIRTYLDTVTGLPWGKYTAESHDVIAAEKILDRDHYGLKKVKERILEYIAVHSLTSKQNSQIICLVGPPGVGKTSIARSVAECMGRKFVRMSLGGVKDESEIRGHRRTYIGSMPGRVIAAIEQADCSNPLILLDEIDKLGNDYRGDPASALLEVLDPEQNSTFNDHFLDLPYDLSRVVFLTTANDPGAIPGPLYDRMEVIELTSYTRIEKFKIAKLHLLKKQLERHGITKEQFSITDKALYGVIDDYTREAGVRNLERRMAQLIRKAAKKIVCGEAETVRVTPDMLEPLLGPPITHGTITSPGEEIGVVNGLAWTAVGGEVMPIETILLPGSGKMEITGSLGDVMKESAKLAVSNVRALSDRYPVPEDLMTKYDLHIHAPEGAVPKDGPSAGVTLTVALMSALCGLPVRKGLAMTGEISLKGKVLPIGGLKEKLLAAYREKLTTVLIPKDNVCDLAEVDEEVKAGLAIVPVATVAEVLKLSLGEAPRKKSTAKPHEHMRGSAQPALV